MLSQIIFKKFRIIFYITLVMIFCFGSQAGADEKNDINATIKAAEQGDAAAQCNLGFMYDNGKGVPQDYKKALYWHTKSAEQGEALAQYNLGIMYDNGEGVPQNYVIAYAWWNLSSANGDKDANKNRDILRREMTSQQIAQAQELSVKFQDKIDRGNKSSDSNHTASNTSELYDPKIKSFGT